MKFKYKGQYPIEYQGKRIEKGDIVESSIELSSRQYEKVEEVETPKKSKNNK